MAHAVYKEFINPELAFTHFMLFTGVTYSITAFPILCGILTELELLHTTVGIIILLAGEDDIGMFSLILYNTLSSSWMDPPRSQCSAGQRKQ